MTYLLNGPHSYCNIMHLDILSITVIYLPKLFKKFLCLNMMGRVLTQSTKFEFSIGKLVRIITKG